MNAPYIETAMATGYGQSVYGTRRERLEAEEDERYNAAERLNKIANDLYQEVTETPINHPRLANIMIFVGKHSAMFERELMKRARVIYNLNY